MLRGFSYWVVFRAKRRCGQGSTMPMNEIHSGESWGICWGRAIRYLMRSDWTGFAPPGLPCGMLSRRASDSAALIPILLTARSAPMIFWLFLRFTARLIGYFSMVRRLRPVFGATCYPGCRVWACSWYACLLRVLRMRHAVMPRSWRHGRQ